MTSTPVTAILDQRVIAIVRAPSRAAAIEQGTRLLDAGLRAVEISLVTPGAIDAIAELADLASEDVHIGVGTALRASDVIAATAAGARFVVAPNLDGDVIRAAMHRAVPCIPGCGTATEAITARRLGADLVKIFPASAWSPAAIRDLLTALPDLPLVPTGGITLDTAPDWIAAGARAVGLGSTLTHAPADETTGRISRLLTHLQKAPA